VNARTTPPRLKIPTRTELSQQPLTTERTILEPLASSMYRKLFRAVDDSRTFLEPWLPWVPYNDSVDASLKPGCRSTSAILS
jgi:hypothetical protein